MRDGGGQIGTTGYPSSGGGRTGSFHVVSRDQLVGEGGAYQVEKNGKVKTGSATDFHSRYGAKGMTIEQLLSKHEVVFAVVANVTGKFWYEFGRRESLELQGLADRYLSGPEVAPGLADMLRDAPRPQVVRQGRVSCALCLRDDGVIVALVRSDDLDVFSRRRWAMTVLTEVDAMGDFAPSG